MNWFGEAWEAPICHEQDPLPTPVGETCPCGRRIEEGDFGFVTDRPWHYDCLMRLILLGWRG